MATTIKSLDFGFLADKRRLEKIISKMINVLKELSPDEHQPCYEAEEQGDDYEWRHDINSTSALTLTRQTDDEGEVSSDGGFVVEIFHSRNRAHNVRGITIYSQSFWTTKIDVIVEHILCGLKKYKNLENVLICPVCDNRCVYSDGLCSTCDLRVCENPQGEPCPICLEKDEPSIWVKTQCCKKVFHYCCLRQLEKFDCPCCRSKINISNNVIIL